MHALRRSSALALAALALGLGACNTPALGDPATLTAPDYGQEFWSHWGDGRAELSTYDLSLPRYGEARTGTAVAIFVTEPFSAAERVKADAGSGDDVFQAIKLNLVKDFSTGIYDYNTMLSAFVAVESQEAAAAGHAVKVSYSSQEWCGQVYQLVVFDNDVVRQTSHSYFAGEADRDDVLARPAHGLSEDALPFWARGLASPKLAPGESRPVMLLRSLQNRVIRFDCIESPTGDLGPACVVRNFACFAPAPEEPRPPLLREHEGESLETIPGMGFETESNNSDETQHNQQQTERKWARHGDLRLGRTLSRNDGVWW
jgi:hypothetical protein